MYICIFYYREEIYEDVCKKVNETSREADQSMANKLGKKYNHVGRYTRMQKLEQLRVIFLQFTNRSRQFRHIRFTKHSAHVKDYNWLKINQNLLKLAQEQE